MPQATRLPVLRDSGASPSSLQLGALYASCLGDLAASSTELSPRSCISLGRNYPALAILLGAALGQDRRAAVLLERYVRDWLVVHTFLAGQARLQSAVGGGGSPDVRPVLDQLAAGLRLVLDPRIAGALAGLPPAALASPDDRGADRPLAYWPAIAADVEGATPLVAETSPAFVGSAVTQLAPGALARDLTATFQAAADVFTQAAWTTIDSPWLSVKLEAPTGGLYELGVLRSTGAGWIPKRGLAWADCMGWAALNNRVAWSWAAPTYGPTGAIVDPSRCWGYTLLGDRLPRGAGWPAWAAGITGEVRTGLLQQAADPTPPAASYLDNFDRPGGDTRTIAGVNWQTCQTTCAQTFGTTPCLAWSFYKPSSVCYLKQPAIGSNGEPVTYAVPPTVPNPAWMSGVTVAGARIEGLIARRLDPGMTWLGTDVATVANTTWDACSDACRANAACEAWVYQKGARFCRLRNQLTGTARNDYNVSAARGGIGTAHATPMNTAPAAIKARMLPRSPSEPKSTSTSLPAATAMSPVPAVHAPRWPARLLQ